tara:strand:+ start:2985 stop:3284 length:300 start_codon:yes stop_codon:yes gene_type:complete
MPKDQLNNNLKIGDLVTHVLYGKKWIGVVVSFKQDKKATSNSMNRKTKALVQIQPGTEFDGFFKRTNPVDRVNDNLGYVSVHWLFKMKETHENFGPPRN